MVREVKQEHMNTIKKIIKDTNGGLLSEIKNSKLWYYTIDEKPVAALGIKDDNVLNILCTSKDYRNRNAAKELFEAVKTILMARGLSTIKANVKEDAAEYFLRLRFIQNGKSFKKDGENYIPMTYSM